MKRTTTLLAACAGSFLLGAFINAPDDPKKPLTTGMIEVASTVFGLEFTPAERDSMLDNLNNARTNYEALRKIDLPNDVAPALYFNPLPAGFIIPTGPSSFKASSAGKVTLPANRDELAFYTVGQLGELIRTKQISSVELTQFFLNRLKTNDPKLHCVITLTEELALTQAKRADAELKAGKYRGPLHGIPYGAKDLLAKKGYKTTWGAAPYKDQTLDLDATVVRKLEEAGAVLCGKMTLGALAMGDVWFGGTTRNPWNTEAGASGSSAGSASSVSAGLLPFAIGTETLGSIVSPSTVCGTTGLRPTFGRVSRHGAMALSWSMDKIGPITRSVEDCALVFNAIYGPDGHDPTVMAAPFRYAPLTTLKGVRVGYVKKAFESTYPNRANDSLTLQTLRSLGAELVPFDLPTSVPAGRISFLLTVEAAASFDELTRSGRDDLMVRQGKNAWPNAFRSARFVPAVEYIQANRARTKLINDMADQLKAAKLDVYISPSYAGGNLTLTNLTGHPCVVLPNGFTKENLPTSITFMGQLFEEGKVLAVAKAYQDATAWHKKHPIL
ncbi:amidase [Spirosoma utsteinense]|uniref:Asp-tRNA(Asn)/Glu-tRNA(Gln) amidotransferase A subunit family amidase n=1 Tax=Spirosoma utsteinense TaxID=2585773 RepID=A0ABR6W458_9BACT|nr:amidase [Spirosoma utsteinense]MBC3787082.1 Asp-tRNA(Asn)/Glu-tRNA(Gln) amidotransferase A subunit family amidase [Spirosoma utsteinense]MBC3791369.1 Asp-tRNA(Asn)/Glu-tRNA(Gln) amidotransferase A subunit family amidase [Spirosoma utsteinense]